MNKIRIALLAICVGGVGVALAQPGRKPDPPVPQPRALPDRVDDLPTFIEAYKRSGQPKILFYVDALSTKTGDASLNQGGLLNNLHARLEDLFRDPLITIVDSGAQTLLQAQQAGALRRNDEVAAAKIVGTAAKADVVVYVRLVEQAGRQDGVVYSGTYVLADLRRGTSLGRFGWDMFPAEGAADFDSYRISEYARAIAKRVAFQYSEAYPSGGSVAGGRRFTIRVVGDYEEDDLTDFRDALGGIGGVVPGSVLLRADEKSSAQSVSTFELLYAGDLLELRKNARRAATEKMAMEAAILDAREGTIDLKLAPLGLSARERQLSGGPESPRNLEARQQLASNYAKAGSPSIAVLINQAAVEKESALGGEGTPGVQSSTPVQPSSGTSIILGERVSIGGTGLSGGFVEGLVDRELRDKREGLRQQRVIDLRLVEDKIVERFIQLGLRPRDVSSAQSEMVKSTGGVARAWDDRALAFDLGKASKADIVISGVGRLVRDGTSDESPRRLVVSVRAFSVATGDVLAATSVQRTLDSGDELFAQAMDEVAAQAVGKLATQLGEAWAKSGGR